MFYYDVNKNLIWQNWVQPSLHLLKWSCVHTRARESEHNTPERHQIDSHEELCIYTE